MNAETRWVMSGRVEAVGFIFEKRGPNLDVSGNVHQERVNYMRVQG